MEETDVIIIGAGLAGLSAGQAASRQGKRCVILEKSRGLGGRAATRRVDDIPVDHGAQFFTARSTNFQQQVHEWMASGICEEWSRGFHFFSEGHLHAPLESDSHPRYVCPKGMTALGKHLAQNLDIRRSCLVTDIHKVSAGFTVTTQEGRQFSGQSLILTAPLPQALALINAHLDEDERARLQTPRLNPCFAIIAETHGPTPLWKGVQVREGALTWMGADFTKRSAIPQRRFIVLHASGDFTRQHFETPLPEVAEILFEEARRIDPLALADLHYCDGHRWRYAKVTNPLPTASYSTRSGIILAGDAFGGTIESAWISGQSTKASSLISPPTVLTSAHKAKRRATVECGSL